MSCTLISLDQSGCIKPFGGLVQSYAVSYDDIEDITFSSPNTVTGITLDGAATLAKYQYAKDDSAYYNQEGSLNGSINVFEQESMFKFLGINEENQEFVYNVTGCCNLILIHVTNTGTILMQGVEYDDDTEEWRLAKNSTKFSGNINTGTSDEESAVEAIFTSQAFFPSPIVDMTIDALDVLAGESGG
ncbi:MAG TPA: hypothetical protein VK031_04750 [Tissierellaceae bacterium]|nr:hypothetical protein [Tissierellaceae bacterium]